jgi:dienelactone hydrolase
VTRTSLTSPHKALLFTPTITNNNNDTAKMTPNITDITNQNETFPAIVFAHGLCGPADLYSDLLTSISSQGYVVIANQEQETCESPTIWNPFSAFTALDSIKEAANGKEMVQHLLDEVDYLLRQRSDVVSKDKGIGLVGHSMGGGAVIDAAAKLSEQEEEGVLKAVVAIAPWNGIPLASRPSDVAGEIKAPTLLFCSETDQITPCSGPWMSGNPALGSSWMSETLLANAFYTTDNTWGGGVQAIFDDTNNKDDDDTTTTYLLQFPNGGHFSLAGIGDDKLRKLGQEIAKGSGLGEWWNSFFIDYNIGVGEDKSNPLGAETAKSVGDSVRSLTIAFLGDTMLVSAEGEKNFTSALLVEGDGEEEGGGFKWSSSN